MLLYYLLTHSLLIATYAASEARVLSKRPSEWAIGQTVSTESGLVHGGAASNAPEVSAYFGIPYAKPPIGDLRFAPPQKYKGKTSIDATKFVSDPLFSLELTLMIYRDILVP